MTAALLASPSEKIRQRPRPNYCTPRNAWLNELADLLEQLWDMGCPEAYGHLNARSRELTGHNLGDLEPSHGRAVLEQLRCELGEMIRSPLHLVPSRV